METIPGTTKGEDRVSELRLNLLVIFFVCFGSELDGQYRPFKDGFNHLHDVFQLDNNHQNPEFRLVKTKEKKLT